MSRGKRAQWRGAWGSFLQLVLARQNVKKTQNFRKIFCSTGRRDRKSDDRKRREAPRNRSITGQTEVIPQSRVPRQANLRLSIHYTCFYGWRKGVAVLLVAVPLAACTGSGCATCWQRKQGADPVALSGFAARAGGLCPGVACLRWKSKGTRVSWGSRRGTPSNRYVSRGGLA